MNKGVTGSMHRVWSEIATRVLPRRKAWVVDPANPSEVVAATEGYRSWNDGARQFVGVSSSFLRPAVPAARFASCAQQSDCLSVIKFAQGTAMLTAGAYSFYQMALNTIQASQTAEDPVFGNSPRPSG